MSPKDQLPTEEDAQQTGAAHPSLPRTLVQPSQDFLQEMQARQVQVGEQQSAAVTANPASNTPHEGIYPMANNDISTMTPNATHAAALQEMKTRSQESNRRVCLRVKSVLVIAVLMLLASVYQLVSGLTGLFSDWVGTIAFILIFVQTALCIILLVSRNKDTVALILKVFLILALVGLFLGLRSMVDIVVGGVMVILLYYAYKRVKALQYY